MGRAGERRVWVLVPAEGPAPRVRLETGSVRIGRDPSGDVIVPDLTVSRRHVRVFVDGDALGIEDLGSSGGTFVNGARVERSALRPGDLVRLGPRIEYRVSIEGEDDTTSLRLMTREPDEKAVRHLQVLLEVAGALNAATVLEEVLDVVLRAAVRLVEADRAFVVLRQPDGEVSGIAAYPAGEAQAGWAVHAGLVECAMAERRSVSASGDQPRQSTSVLTAPLIVCRRPLVSAKDASFVATLEVHGAIIVERHGRTAGFSRSQLAVFESLASDAASTIDSARLYREARAKAKFEHEMALARTIQSALLLRPPDVGFASVFATSQSARSVGGDLYHAAVRPDGALAVAVGDVSGKGVPAALIMAMAQGLLGLLHDLGQPLSALLPVLDRSLARYNPGNRFLTLVAALLYPDGRLEIANGGHCPAAIVRTDGRVSLLPADGPMLGLVDGISWGSQTVMLGPGDLVVLYSDGLPESFSSAHKEFGLDGVERALATLNGREADELGVALLEAAAAHRGGHEPDDDLTLLAVRYAG